MITPHTTLPHSSAKNSHGCTNVIYMTTKKPTKKTVAKKPVKKAAPKKAAPKKASPATVTVRLDTSAATENTVKQEPKNLGTVVYAADIKNLSLRDRVYNWFRK